MPKEQDSEDIELDDTEDEAENDSHEEKGLLEVQWQQRQRRIERRLSNLTKTVEKLLDNSTEKTPTKGERNGTTNDLPLTFGQVEALLFLQEKRILQALQPKEVEEDHPEVKTKPSPPGTPLKKPFMYRRKR